MNKHSFKIIQYVASFLFAICILFYLFRNQDPVKLVEEILSVRNQMGNIINALWINSNC